jgi:hypothetical protein
VPAAARLEILFVRSLLLQEDVRKRLNTTGVSPKKNLFEEEEEQQRELRPMVPRVRADVQPERGFAPILPKLSDYEL